ncbi:MAG TPA: hypothetical protein VMR79_09475 [Verrucomicrobiae bacterium]|nr:hypothetical protein [Verrucomicrobiae bacterium]
MAAVLLAVPAARAAVVAAPGYAVHTIATPDTVEGGVVRQGDAILVGQGPSFMAGAQSIVRLDADGPTTIATGFNSLGGFDLAPDGTLYVVDNCFTGDGCGTTATGDTVYAIPDALTRTTAVTAAGHEVVPAGTIPFAADVFVAPGGAALVSDAAGNGAGRVVKVVPGTATDLITGLDLVGGIALAADGTLRIVDAVLNSDFTTTGKVLEYKLDGTPLGTLVSGLQGGFGAAMDGAGNLLVSSIESSGTSKVIAVAPDGSVSDRATGFSFSGDISFDAARDEALVLDFGVTDIVAICRDQDGDGVCDADDPCTGAAIVGGKLTLGKLGAPAGDDTLAFKGRMTVPVAPAIDPVTTGVRVLVEGVLDATIPGGAFDPATGTGWKMKKNGVFTYRNGQGGILGIMKVALKVSSKTPGLVQFAVRGKGGSYIVDPTHLPRQATLILDAAAGQCGDAGFAGPAPAPVCVYETKHPKVQCK